MRPKTTHTWSSGLIPPLSRPHLRTSGFNILESLLMLLLLAVLAMTTLAIYRKGPPSGGWWGDNPRSSDVTEEGSASDKAETGNPPRKITDK